MPATEPATGPTVLGKNDDGRRFLSGRVGEEPGLAPPRPADRPPLIVTKEHRRFEEFADTVRRHRYIGVCWGPPGVGKTLSARHYAGADDWEQWQRAVGSYQGTGAGVTPGPVPARILQARTCLWTPTVTATAKEVDLALPRACQQISYAVDYHRHGHVDPYVHTESAASGLTELLIIDETDRLKTTGLEQVRDYYDRHNIGVVLIGMPGIERCLARYPQLYSRIGFAHEYRPLTTEELTAVLTRRWHADGLASDDDFTQTVAIATIARITGGNFRLVDRLLAQIQRIRQINHLTTVTPEVVEAAREALLIGT
jgi:DNA transposition AAA+ family ATPase